MKRLALLAAAAALGVAGNAAAADTSSTKPTSQTTKAAKPSARGPGTQTEDDLYIGARAPTTPKAATDTQRLQTRDIGSKPPASPANNPKQENPKGR